jgi:hypothetical protein
MADQYGVMADFGEWDPVWLATGQEEVRWFTWTSFEPGRWSAMHANPWGSGWGVDTGMTVQIIEQWTEKDGSGINNYIIHWIRVKNIGPKDGSYIPQAIVVPAKHY